jgi:ABC-type lipoprotein release transport system permease subunit
VRFGAVVVGTVALGVGAVATVFSVANAVLLRELPYPNPDRLVTVWERSPSGNPTIPANPNNFWTWVDRNRTFGPMAMYLEVPANLGGDGEPEQVVRLRVSRDYFDVLGVRPALGRSFVEEEMAPGGPQVAVIGHDLWRRRFGADAGAVGRTVMLDWVPCTIIGVMPQGFRAPLRPAEMWTQLDIPRSRIAGGRFARVIGRLRPGVALAEARADLEGIARETERERPERNKGWSATVVPLAEYSSSRAASPLWRVLGAVALTMLLVCVNVAGLMLVRTSGRQRELAIREWLGATPGRLRRERLREGLALSCGGGALGLWAASWGLELAVDLLPADLWPAHLGRIEMDWRVLGVAVAASLLAGVAGAVLRPSARSRRVLVAAQFAIALAVLTGATSLLRSAAELRAAHPGFQADHLLTGTLMMGSPSRERAADVQGLLERVLERVRAVPGVRAAASTQSLPLADGGMSTGFAVEGRPGPPPTDRPQTQVTIVSTGYFATMGIPLLRGRVFTPRDRQGSPPVVVINQEMSRRHFGGSDPLGQRLTVFHGGSPQPSEVVGVVGDVPTDGLLDRVAPGVYQPHLQQVWGTAYLAIRTQGDPMAQANAIRAAVRQVDPLLPLADVRTMEDRVAASWGAARIQSWLVPAFGAVALLLASVGLFAVLAFSVAGRRREIGIRMAVGARAWQVAAAEMRGGMGLATSGSSVGGGIAWLAGLNPSAAPVLAMLAAAAIACWIPARRAARVDPLEALRHE